MIKKLALLILFVTTPGWTFTANVMAPLQIGDVRHPNDPANLSAWTEFDGQLKRMKDIGVYAVSTDIWWGVVEPQDGTFTWAYYDELVQHLKKANLKWVPILSFHQCGGNVGDACNFPLPAWIWTKYIGASIPTSDSLKYKSEQGHTSPEYVSAWGTKFVIGDYVQFMQAFQTHFTNQKDMIAEINVSLGPAGELRYPSYNTHDVGTGYPTRGALQAYSDLAIASFRTFVANRYQSNIALVNQAWGSHLSSFDQIFPPTDAGDAPPNQFFQRGDQRTPYGRDFFAWYNQSLVDHGKLMLKSAVDVFNSDSSPFKGIDIGAKVSGIHWRMASDRLAELAAGVVDIEDGFFNKGPDGETPQTPGYHNIVSVFAQNWAHHPRMVMHFTCLEKDNHEDQEHQAQSLAQTLVFWIAAEADRQHVAIKGENALSGPLSGQHAWDNLKNAVQYASYQGLTILRIGELNDYGVNQYGSLIHFTGTLNK